MVFDSSARNSMENGEKARDFRLLFEPLLQSPSDVLWAKELPSNRLLHISDGVKQVYGRDASEFQASEHLWLEVIHHEDRSSVEGALEHLLHQGRIDLYYRIIKPDGSIRMILDRVLLKRDESGRAAYIVGIVSDISECKSLDLRLRAINENLQSLIAERTAELAAANIQLAQEIAERRRHEERIRDHEAEIVHYHRLHTLGEMASGIAHELNQPLSAISNYAESCLDLIHERRSNIADTEFAMSQIVELSGRAGEIIRRLRALAKKREPRRSTLDVAEVAREAMRYVEREAVLAEVVIQFKVLAQPALVIADSLQIQQVIINLTRNAIDALAALPHQERFITVSIRERSNGMVEFSVHNPGPVISSEILPHIFEPFFTTKDDGLGMGLAICRRVLESHGGTIHAKSTYAAGTKITCRLPAIVEESVDEA